MIDFHSHILPKMDDGSKSVEESLELLAMLAEQGVKKVVATPHFYANDESVEKFLTRRQKAYETLCAALPDGMPEILLGAEVRYYQGISRLKELKALCVQGSNLLLLEMPEVRWTEYVAKEVQDLTCLGDLTLILAHVDRCLHFQSGNTLKKIAESGVVLQINAEAITAPFRRRAMTLLKSGAGCLIGSDCHNLTDRPPYIGKAFDLIRKKMGEDFAEHLILFENSLLEQSKAKK